MTSKIAITKLINYSCKSLKIFNFIIIYNKYNIIYFNL